MNVVVDESAQRFTGNKWFSFGYNLGLKVQQLHKIEDRYHHYKPPEPQYIREVVFLWRKHNKTASWKPVADALRRIELPTIADKLEDQFKTAPTEVPSKIARRYIEMILKICM